MKAVDSQCYYVTGRSHESLLSASGDTSADDDASDDEMMTLDASFEGCYEEQIDPDFLTKHLREAPPYISYFEFEKCIANIIYSGTKGTDIKEAAAKGLTIMGKALFNALDNKMQEEVRRRYQIPQDKPGHLVFVNQYRKHPTSSADTSELYSIEQSPKISAVYNAEGLTDCHGMYQDVPWNCVEGIVDAEIYGRSHVEDFAYHHHRVRPDRPMMYCLIIRPEWYQIVLSSPAGIVASPPSPWYSRLLLAAYIYSHYDPPSHQVLVGDTSSWIPRLRTQDLPTMAVTVNRKTYVKNTFCFLGKPWGRQTMVLKVL